jgi:hypothetical protein
MPDEPSTLHLHAQDRWQSDAHLVATRAGLERLRAAIDLALECGSAKARVSAADDQTYDLLVAMVRSSDMQQMPLPYTGDFSQDFSRDRWEFFYGHPLVREAATAEPVEAKTPDGALASGGSGE